MNNHPDFLQIFQISVAFLTTYSALRFLDAISNAFKYKDIYWISVTTILGIITGIAL